MNDRFDDERALRRLLAGASTEPAGEDFVSRVARRIGRRRLMARLAQGVALLAMSVAVVALVPIVVPVVTWVAEAPATSVPSLEALLLSPVGLALATVAAGLALAQVLAAD